MKVKAQRCKAEQRPKVDGQMEIQMENNLSLSGKPRSASLTTKISDKPISRDLGLSEGHIGYLLESNILHSLSFLCIAKLTQSPYNSW